jgi:hypothetical protein
MIDPSPLELELLTYGHQLRRSLSDHDLSAPVMATLRGATVDGRARRRRRHAVRVAILAAVIVLVAASAAFATYRVVFAAGPVVVHSAPSPDLSVGRRLELGAPVRANDPRVRIPVVAPHVAWLRNAPQWWVDNLAADQVSLTFPPQRELPEIATTGVGLLVQEFDGEGVEAVRKYLTTSTNAERVRIGSSTGVFLTGSEHMLFYLDHNGRYVTSPGRLVGNALIFQRRGLTIRIEGEITREKMREIAMSLR